MNLDRFYEFKNFINANARYIYIEANRSWENIGFSQSEPDIIWQYLKDGTNYLNQNIGQYLLSKRRDFIVKFAGVFIHQKPRIERINTSCYTSSLKCELGDLLTVFLFIDRNKNLIYQSAFISQAKKEDRIDNKCQLCLYEEDKIFKLPKYMRRDLLTLERRPPQYYRRHRGLNYLILDNIPFVKYIPFRADIKVNWGFIVYQMLLGLNGLYFTRYLPRDEHIGWSRMIWDLIYFTGKSGYKNATRGNVINIFLNEFNDFDDYNNNFIYIENKDGEENGIPIFFIIVQDKEKESNIKKS